MDVGDWEGEPTFVGDLGTGIIGMVVVGADTVIAEKNRVQLYGIPKHLHAQNNQDTKHNTHSSQQMFKLPVYIHVPDYVPVVVGVAGISVSTEIIVNLCEALHSLPVSVMLMV